MSESESTASEETRRRLDRLGSYYRGFVEVVGAVLLVLLASVAVVSIIRLARGAFTLVLSRALESIEFQAFQTVFGMALTVFILLELLHAIVFQFVGKHEPHLLLRSFLLIALLALARKILLVEVDPELLIAISIAILSLSVSVWILGRSSWVRADGAGVSSPAGEEGHSVGRAPEG